LYFLPVLPPLYFLPPFLTAVAAVAAGLAAVAVATVGLAVATVAAAGFAAAVGVVPKLPLVKLFNIPETGFAAPPLSFKECVCECDCEYGCGIIIIKEKIIYIKCLG
jgi:hypothetical protein